MIGLTQRVSEASVDIEGERVASIERGILLLLGVEKDDTSEHTKKLLHKVSNYRIFEDDTGRMNHSLMDVGGELLVVSQFTLPADTRKGMRPGFSRGAPPELGKALYDEFVELAKDVLPEKVQTGRFAADMKVALVNDGPVTFWLQV